MFLEERSKIVYSKILKDLFDLKILEDKLIKEDNLLVKNVFKLSVKGKVR